MNIDKPLPKWILITISGSIVILFYCTFTFISWGLYPDPFGPVTHYLSRLGNFDYSPFGAYFYNLGCILTGIALIPFFLGLYIWHSERTIGRVIMVCGQIVGLASAIALIMIGVFSEDQGAPHMTASSIFFELNFVVLIIVNLALLFHPAFNKIIALYGVSIDILTLIFAIQFGGPLVEWFTVFGSLLFVGLISLNSLKLHSDENDDEQKESLHH